MLNCFERSRAKGDVAEKCFDLQPRKIKGKITNTFKNWLMNLKGIGLWSVRKEHFSIFTCVFARESHVCGKSLDKIHVCCHVDLFPE